MNEFATKWGADNSLVIPKDNDNPVKLDTPLEKSYPTSSGDIAAYFGAKIIPSSYTQFISIPYENGLMFNFSNNAA